jgi:hypothetical protein
MTKDEELTQAYANLTSVQERCTELLNSVRAATSFSLGRDGDNDKRNFVLVARQFTETHHPDVHPWGVFVCTSTGGVMIRGQGRNAELEEKSRQFDTQADALAYGWSLLAQLRN